MHPPENPVRFGTGRPSRWNIQNPRLVAQEAAAQAGGLDDVCSAVGGRSTAWFCSTTKGRVIRDALLYDTRSSVQAEALINELGAAR